MDKKLQKMLDAPDKQIIGVSLIYSFFGFFSFPFILLLVSQGVQSNLTITCCL